jgi:Holliday junction resolvase
MVLKPVKRDPTRLEMADVFRRIDRGGGPIGDPRRIDDFLNSLRGPLGDVVTAPTVVRGLRAQAMFASLVVALDGCKMMMTTDSGELFVDEPAKAADFLLVLRDGRRLVVEVKSFTLKLPSDLIKVTAKELLRLQRFADMLDAELFIAVFMTSIGHWALVPASESSEGRGGHFAITVERAFMVDHMNDLGDEWIGIAPPIRLAMLPEQPSTIDEGGEAEFTVGAVELFVGGSPMQTSQDRKLAAFMLMYGDWAAEEFVDVQDGSLRSMAVVAEPKEPVPGQGFEFVGRLSSMYTRLFLDATQDEGGQVTALDTEARPGFLPTLLPRNFESPQLPIWRFHLRPNAERRVDS